MSFENRYITEDVCPFCEKRGADSGNPQVDGDDFWVDCSCPHCGMLWQDIYMPEETQWKCPSCGSPDIEGTSPEVDGPNGQVQCECRTCGAFWTETYRYKYSEER